MAPGGIRPGPPTSHVPYSQGPPSTNGPIQSGVGSPSHPPIPGALSGPSQFQQPQHSHRPTNEVSQNPGRPPMMGMPPMAQGYAAGPASMPPPSGPMMPPMNGPGGIRPPGMGAMPPSSIGGYPPHTTGINTPSTVSK